MRKLFLALLLSAYILSSFICFNIYKFKEDKNVVNGNALKVKIEDNSNFSINEYFEYLVQVSEKYNLHIMKVVRKPRLDDGRNKTLLYSSFINNNDLIKRVPLKNGRFPNSGDDEKIFISTELTNDTNQVGQIELFDKTSVLEIRTLKAAAESNESRTGIYLLYPNKNTDIKSIKAELERKSIILSLSNINEAEIRDNSFIIKLIICLIIGIVFVCITFIFVVYSRYKEIAVKRMFGYAIFDLLKEIFLQVFKFSMFVLILSFIFQIIFLKFYNNFSRIKDFAIYWIIFQITLSVILYILFIIIYYLLLKIVKINEVLKMGKPIELILYLNLFTKIVLSIILLIITLISVDSIFYYSYKQNAEKNMEFILKDYAFLGFTAMDRLETKDNYHEYYYGQMSKKLFELENKNGALLCKSSQLIKLVPKIAEPDSGEFDPYDGVIHINNNYLKINPIYDVEGSQVLMDNENDLRLIVLIPEKYRGIEQKLKKLYLSWYNWHYYKDRDVYEQRNNIINKTQKQNLDVKFIFIKNGQIFQNLNPINIERDESLYYKDLLAIVVNNANMGGDAYLHYLSGRYFYPRINIDVGGFERLKENIRKVGLERAITETPLLYTTVENEIREIFLNLSRNLIVLFIIALVFITIVFCTIMTFLETYKSINSVTFLYGYSFYRRYSLIFASNTILWILMVMLVYVLNVFIQFVKVSIEYFILCMIICSLVEFAISFLCLCLKERKKAVRYIKDKI